MLLACYFHEAQRSQCYRRSRAHRIIGRGGGGRTHLRDPFGTNPYRANRVTIRRYVSAATRSLSFELQRRRIMIAPPLYHQPILLVLILPTPNEPCILVIKPASPDWQTYSYMVARALFKRRLILASQPAPEEGTLAFPRQHRPFRRQDWASLQARPPDPC